ncbi:MAG: ABC transporter ATP-binding protein [Anaerolineales bacterium]|nr:ABC transporter ATP-binding protein [Anaerolineales bacterium]
MTQPILSFRNVSFGYLPSHPILQDVDFDLHTGQVAAVLGPNGAGKTTLLSLTLGWLAAWTGEIHLTGIPLKTLPPRERGRRMALVPQSEHIPFEYTVLEYVLLGRAPHLPPLEMPGRDDYQIAANALGQVGLSEMQNRSILNLSGGERQLVLVARALAQQPRLLLLDEPTSHLDLSNKGRLIHLLRELSGRGVSILFTTHEPEVASALADHLMLMQKGQLLRNGTLDEVFTSQDLSLLYQLPVSVVEVNGRKVALWI